MRDNRDMFYSNLQQGGFSEPNFMPMGGVMPQAPSGYNINSNFQAYGPNVMPMQNPNTNNINNTNNTYIDEYDNRITKLERQIRRIDQRLRKLENIGTNIEEEVNIDSNMYMI